jgi:hypothetical protein
MSSTMYGMCMVFLLLPVGFSDACSVFIFFCCYQWNAHMHAVFCYFSNRILSFRFVVNVHVSYGTEVMHMVTVPRQYTCITRYHKGDVTSLTRNVMWPYYILIGPCQGDVMVLVNMMWPYFSLCNEANLLFTSCSGILTCCGSLCR